MIHKFLFAFTFLSITSLSYGQDFEWYEFEFDQTTVDFPQNEISVIDTISNDIRIYQLFANINGSVLIAQKTPIAEDDSFESLNSIPHNISSLKRYYELVAQGIQKSIESDSFEMNEINYDGIIGSVVLFEFTDSNMYYETKLFVLNNNLYAFSYYNDMLANEALKDEFLNSISIKDPGSIDQFKGNSMVKRLGYKAGEYLAYLTMLGIAACVILIIVKLSRRM